MAEVVLRQLARAFVSAGREAGELLSRDPAVFSRVLEPPAAAAAAAGAVATIGALGGSVERRLTEAPSPLAALDDAIALFADPATRRLTDWGVWGVSVQAGTEEEERGGQAAGAAAPPVAALPLVAPSGRPYTGISGVAPVGLKAANTPRLLEIADAARMAPAAPDVAEQARHLVHAALGECGAVVAHVPKSVLALCGAASLPGLPRGLAVPPGEAKTVARLPLGPGDEPPSAQAPEESLRVPAGLIFAGGLSGSRGDASELLLRASLNASAPIDLASCATRLLAEQFSLA